jgi:Delta7-sterol 5-desaturase
MDLVLSVADNIIFDTVWAKLIPATAFPIQGLNSTQYPVPPQGTWMSMVTRLPHPPLDADFFLKPETPAFETPSILKRFDSTPPIPSAWPRSYVPRQLASLIVITLIGIHLLYFIFASLSYFFIFDKRMMKHPRFLKNQIRQEILCSLKAFPGMTICTLPFFQAEVMGYSRLYDDPKKYGYAYLGFSAILFVFSLLPDVKIC